MAKKITPNRLQSIVRHCLEVDHRLKEGKDFEIRFDEGVSGGQHTVTARFTCNNPHVYNNELRALSQQYGFIFLQSSVRQAQELQEA